MNEQDSEKITVLIVDDKLENLDVLIAYLERFDFRFLVARSGEEMFKRIEQATPDMILLDVLMPDMNGFEACRRLKANETFKDIPVIFMTALSDTIDKVKGFEVGAVDYITKPFRQEEVLARVRMHVTIQHLKKDLQIKNQKLQHALERERKLLEDLRVNLSLSLPHELRTPLTGIIGFSGFLTDPQNLPKPDTIAKFGNEIYKNSLRLQRLVENSLLYANLKLLQYTSKKRQTRQNEYAFDAEGIIASIARQGAKDARRQDDLVLELNHANIKISSKNFEKILTELLDNAFKFSQQGSPVRVTTTVDGDQCCIRITDQGRGMTEEQIATIGAYMQFDRRQHEQQGVGLGLIIAHLLTQLDDGELTIESVPNHGTTVSIVFKCERDEIRPAEKGDTYWFDTEILNISKGVEKQHAIGQNIVAYTPLLHLKILVVSDRWEDRTVFVNLLSPLGFEVLEAFDRLDGLHKTLKYQPNLIFMDLVMPEASDFEIVRQIQSSAPGKPVKIVAVSSQPLDLIQQKELASYYSEIIPKPVPIAELFDKLKLHLGLEWVFRKNKEEHHDTSC